MLRDFNLNPKDRQSLFSIYVSVLSILLCMVCLVGSSWAWFTANYELSVASIECAEYSLETVSVSRDGSNTEISLNATEIDRSFYAEANTVYMVTAKTQGTARGYLIIKTCDGDFYLEKADNTFEFDLLLSQSGDVTVSASWGAAPEKSSDLDKPKFGNGELAEDIAEASETASENTEAKTEESTSETAESAPSEEISAIPGTENEAATENSTAESQESAPAAEPEPSGEINPGNETESSDLQPQSEVSSEAEPTEPENSGKPETEITE